MGTVIAETGIALGINPEILGPDSPYEKARLALKKEWEPVLLAAKAVKVDSNESAEEATKLGRLLQGSVVEIQRFYKPVKQQIDALKKPVLDSENEAVAAIDTEKRRLGSEITSWNLKQQKIREEQERVAREAAEKQAREDALNRAIELEDAGQAEQAAAILEETEHAPAVVIQSVAPPKPRGLVGKTTYTAIVTDHKALLKAVLDGVVPMIAIMVNQSYLNKRADGDKEGFSIPGCKLDKQTSSHFRG